jgi:carbonic anhydrase
MPGGHLRNLVERITPSLLAARRNGLTVVNDKQTAERQMESSQLTSAAVEDGRTAVIGVSHRLAEGAVVLVSAYGALVHPDVLRSQR